MRQKCRRGKCCYNIGIMANNKVTFQLDISAAGREILQDMVTPVVKKSADAIAARASSIAASISGTPPSFNVTTRIGIIKRGTRAIATVSADALDENQMYLANTVLSKSKDAGKVN